MNEWLYVMIFGLGLDIVGVWMLASPLLKIDLRHKETIDKKTKDALEEYQRVKDQKPGTPKSEFPTWPAFAHLDLIVLQLHQRLVRERIMHRKRAIIALIIITVGFSLQILANILQFNSIQN